MKKLTLALALAALLSGCASTFESGHEFNMACVDQFQKGVTTKAEAIRCLGAPQMTKQSAKTANREMLVWVHSKTTGSMFSNPQTQSQSLGIIFQDGKYESVTVRENAAM